MNKLGLEFNFNWLFAVIVGAVVIFITIYAIGQIAGQKEEETATYISKQLDIFFDPLETGIASGKSTQVTLGRNIRINNKCSSQSLAPYKFGKQEFSISEFTRNQWNRVGLPAILQDKYIFSDNMLEGKKFYFFSKNFEFPFKVSNIIFMTTENYCFINAPSEIRDEIQDLRFENIQENSFGNCTESSIKVCFGSDSNCDILVEDLCNDYSCEEYEIGRVSKTGYSVDYVGSLVYAAIFSSQEVYECNVQRLMIRVKELCSLYADEVSFLSRESCGSELRTKLLYLGAVAENLPLLALRNTAQDVEDQHSSQECKIWQDI